MSPEPFVSRAKALPAKRREKGYGDENGVYVSCTDKTKLIARLVLWKKGKIYWPIFQLAELVVFRATSMGQNGRS